MKNFSFKLANFEHSKKIWEWRNDEITREMSINSEFISWEIHNEWFESTLNDSNKYLYVGYLEKDIVGIVRFDKYYDEENCFLININIDPSMRNLGLGKIFLKQSIKKFFGEVKDADYIIADIKKENQASIKIFYNSDFRIQEINKEIIRYLFIRK